MSELPKTLLLDIGNTRVHWRYTNQHGAFDLDTESAHVVCVEPSQVHLVFYTVVAADHRWKWLQRVFCNAKWVQCEKPEPELLPTRYDVNQLGIDRWLAMLGAWRVHQVEPLSLIVDVGTAMTLDVLDQHGHRGGWIGPGLQMWIQSITLNTNIRLEAVSPKRREVGTNTADAITQGWLAAVSSLITMTQQDVGAQTLVLTGGDAHLLSPFFPTAKYFDQLVLDGLEHWAKVCIKSGQIS